MIDIGEQPNPPEINTSKDTQENLHLKNRFGRFKKFFQRLKNTALVITAVSLPSAPIVVRAVATIYEAGIPYIIHRGDPQNRHLIVQGVEDAMGVWPQPAREILVPLFDRVDEDRKTGTRFIGPIIASSYGIPTDTSPVLEEWRLWDEAESLNSSLNEEAKKRIEVLDQEISILSEANDTTIPYEERLEKFSARANTLKDLPDIDTLMLNPEFRELYFVATHQAAFPQLTIEQLRMAHAEVGYHFHSSGRPVEDVREYNDFVVDGKYPNSSFEYYWILLNPHFPDKDSLYFDIKSSTAYQSDDDATIKSFRENNITSASLIWAITKNQSNVVQFLEDAKSDPDLYKNTYGISSTTALDALSKLASFAPEDEKFEDQVKEANQLLDEVDLQLFPDAPSFPAPSPSENMEETSSITDANVLISEFNRQHFENLTPTEYLDLASFSIKHSPDDPVYLFKTFVSYKTGKSSFSEFKHATSTDIGWNNTQIIDYYDELFAMFPDLPAKAVTDASAFSVWTQIRNGTRDIETIKNTTKVVIMANQERLKTLYAIDVKITGQRLTHELIETMFTNNVITEPIELTNYFTKLKVIRAKSFSGVYGDVDPRSISLSSEVFYRDSELKDDQIALVIPWSYFLSGPNAPDYGIINPASQLVAGQMVSVSSPEGEGDLNKSVNNSKKMLAITSTGTVIEKPWSEFGDSESEIYQNMQTAGIVSAFTPNYLYDKSHNPPLSEMGLLNDHRNNFLVVYENNSGETAMGVLILKPEYSFDEEEIVSTAGAHAPQGYSVRSIAWGDPGYGTYFRTNGTTRTLLGLNERETYRLILRLN